MTHSLLVVVLMVVGVSYGRQWTNLDELEDYLTKNYDRPLGFEDTEYHLDWYEDLIPSNSQVPNMWSGGIVLYQIDENASNKQRSLILEAMRVIEGVSCVKFKPGKRQGKLTIQVERDPNTGACYSNVGYIPWGGILHLGKECFDQGTIIHELLHTLGMSHQQSASNRDDYVTIHWDSIPEVSYKNYRKNEKDIPAEREFGYDYQSIMHYGSYGYHPSVGLYVGMTAKDPNVKLVEQPRMSHKDILKLNRMYNCIQQY